MTKQIYILAMGGQPFTKSGKNQYVRKAELDLIERLRRLPPEEAKATVAAMKAVVMAYLRAAPAPERHPSKMAHVHDRQPVAREQDVVA